MRYVPVGEQVAIVEGDASALVLGGPGRGKTVTALAAATQWLSKTAGGRALFTSFSNAAVRRLAAAAGLKHDRRLEFRTFHSIALEVLKDYGRFVGLQQPARALDRMEERLVVAENGWSSADQAAGLELHARKTGRISFSLMVPWATILLSKSPTLRAAFSGRYRFIVVDEFQDTNEEQWQFLRVLGEGSRVLALGDQHQMIYGRQFEAVLRRFDEFEVWKSIKRTPLGLDSFRCRIPEILAFGEALLNGRRNGVTGERLAFYPVFRNQTRAQLAMIWAAIRKHANEQSNIAFLVPSAARGEQLAEDLRTPDKSKAIPIPIRARMESSEERLDAFRLCVYAAADLVTNDSDRARQRLAFALETLVSLASRRTLTAGDISKLLAPKSRAASSARNFLMSSPSVLDLNVFGDQFLSALEQDKRFDVPARSVRWQGLPEIEPFEAGAMFDSYRANRAPRMEGFVPTAARTSIMSMHRCKGREFDFVVMVVDPKAHRVDADIGELRRLHYVAATRAKEWLGVVYVRNDVGSVLAPVLGAST